MLNIKYSANEQNGELRLNANFEINKGEMCSSAFIKKTDLAVCGKLLQEKGLVLVGMVGMSIL